jgi:hypothetical protein
MLGQILIRRIQFLRAANIWWRHTVRLHKIIYLQLNPVPAVKTDLSMLHSVRPQAGMKTQHTQHLRLGAGEPEALG